jgi:hypothetical protein
MHCFRLRVVSILIYDQAFMDKVCNDERKSDTCSASSSIQIDRFNTAVNYVLVVLNAAAAVYLIRFISKNPLSLFVVFIIIGKNRIV